MARSWTPAQSAAINTKNKTLLVSAAAGSGKTAALTERIIRAISDKNDPRDISKMLVVTFTRAAAAELRQRIFSALADALAEKPDDKYLSEQLVCLSNAKICTIDSFYLDVVRSGFSELGISQSFRTADEAELDVLAKTAMEDAIDAFYERDAERISHAAECFVSMRNSARLADVFLSLYSATESLPEGIDLLRESAERAEREADSDFFSTSWGKVLKNGALDEMSYIASVFADASRECLENDLLAEKYFPSFSYDATFAKTLAELLEKGTYTECKTYAESYSPISLSAVGKGKKTEQSEELKERRTELVKKIRALIKKSFSLSQESISVSMKKTAEVTRTVYELLADFSARFEEEKRRRNVSSFSDVRRYAMKLLVNEDGTPTKTAIEYSERFTDIYIDEYQDVDRVQDLIFRAIAKPTARFMVGDIKQSIYGFRGAEPDVFAQYRRDFPEISTSECSDTASIFMSNNFRCDESVVKFTNTVCSHIFSACANSIGYTKEDDLVFSKVVENRVTPEVPVEISLLIPSEDKELDIEDKNDVEARYIASQIVGLLENGRLADGKRIEPHDIAVLFRSKATAEYISRALAEAGIPASSSSSARYFENPDVLLVLCLLNAIDNPQRDVYLAGLLRSPFFNFTMEELIEIRANADQSASLYDALLATKELDGNLSAKCHAFDARLSEFRDRAVSLTVDKLLQYLFSTDLFLANGLINNDETNNLLRLYEYARKYENGSFKGLYNFLGYVNRLIDEEKQIESETVSATEGKVTLMNIHKSKGLEFPVVFLCMTHKEFNTQDTRESLVYNPSLGVAMKIADDTGLARTNTPMREALIRLTEVKNTEEEMRILYVALTRARERLYVSASPNKTEEKLRARAEAMSRYGCDYTVRSTKSYIDWILASLGGATETDFCRVSFIERCNVEAAALAFSDELMAEEKNEVSGVSEIVKTLSERFSFVYPYRKASELPAKISVSKLLPETPRSTEENEITELFEENDSKYMPPAILRGEKTDTITPTMRGTATHLFLQFCDYEKLAENGVKEELARLVECGFIPSDSERLVFMDELERFTESELFVELSRAKNIIREQRFNILLPPSALSTEEDFLRQTEGEMLAVQGVIDLLYKTSDGELILCDYKTDRLTYEERQDAAALKQKMTERHAKQLRYYAEAVEKLFERKCQKVLVYSTHAARTVEIDV